MSLDIQATLDILRDQGPLSTLFTRYESRTEQKEMLRLVVSAFNEKQVALIEAGTGVGKSLAYLIPAVLWAAKNQERVVISTHTIHLQEQLLHKDLPLAIQALDLSLHAVIVKGMGNYVCLRKVDEMESQIPLLSDPQAKAFETVASWAQQTKEGTRSSLPFPVSADLWEQVSAEGDTCTKKKCPFYEQCHFFKARQSAEEAQILVVNHSLLFADLTRRAEGEEGEEVGILPSYRRVVIDEAHQIEDVATHFFSDTVSDRHLQKILSRLAQEKHGRLFQLHQLVRGAFQESQRDKWRQLEKVFAIELPAIATELFYAVEHTFEAYGALFSLSGSSSHQESKLRLLPSVFEKKLWKEQIIPATSHLISLLRRFAESVSAVLRQIQELDLKEPSSMVLHAKSDCLALSNRLLSAAEILEKVLDEKLVEGEVKWVEKRKNHTHLFSVSLDIQNLLAERLYLPFESTMLCSATLSINETFDFVKERLGLLPEYLGEKPFVEKRFASPFDYQKQALFVASPNLPTASQPNFYEAFVDQLVTTIDACQGHVFVLFTSYSMLNRCSAQIEKRLSKGRFPLLKQGECSRERLLHLFQSTPRSVLFGTDSFWEGVDVAGDALRCVVIAKLPFEVPSDPLTEARTESVAKLGKDPFLAYSVPKAVMKFKQGVGRLIRSQQDRGCVVCLDSRLVTKGYGKQFLKSLPPYSFVMPSEQTLHSTIRTFFRSP